jgi:hypothetical protein
VTRKIFVLALISGFFTAAGQINPLNPVRLAQNKFAKTKWQEGRALLDKAIRKDSLQIQARFVYGLLFLNPRYGKNNVDSANRYSKMASQLYAKSSIREKDRLKKFPIDSLILTRLQSNIDSLAFELAKQINTENSYLHFLTNYNQSKQEKQAIELRDEAAFVDALKRNEYWAFQNFIKKYPYSHRSAEAKQRFEKLLYEFSTRSKTVEEYKNFIANYPSSPHVPEAIENVFMMETESGEAANFERFIRFYPNTPQSIKASAILFHILNRS